MKQVVAFIRPRAVNETREALVGAGVSGFTVRKVLGRGRGNVDFRVLHGAAEGQVEAIVRLGEGPILVAKRMVSVVVPDDLVAPVIKTIVDANRTGNPGDGKIFVLPVAEAIRIRTGERDAEALK